MSSKKEGSRDALRSLKVKYLNPKVQKASANFLMV